MNTMSSILDNKIIAIIRGANSKDVLNMAKALHEGGVNILEITMNSPNALSAIEEITVELGDRVVVGAGTVLDSETARAAILAGAKFILSPTVDIETIQMAKRYGAVSIPGAFTPTEILSAYENGGDIIKVFPATLGPGFIKDIRGPLPQIPLLPTGGIDLNNIQEFMKAGAIGCGIGSALVNTQLEITDEYFVQLTEKARQFASAVQSNED
ncbi:bifunctional 4-hydroxy-2-oxoglutarate aldolase/2-dehydro-3-deoxy-phosphogluconate aldolase [Paenibacillus lautus]|uniref:bifunctional 4-hydroxy-2-oxoglutarate aldolase/2-dehydro-3-deoxy-phosphogluconate aldolase n=1 Tax=Paenibacillus lautus TaxID=1401 RepID=UPI000BBD5E43|nr:bifunctional 4-hydroxy-2-oxoglutarate aldolase/2-dehydro-3-deoxy-phosphogluconate aldolase [Paenibacillus lautus]PCL90498.1 2-dehydro-3-deoxyphosphogluconate aldolase [Paenibacillus lautus]